MPTDENQPDEEILEIQEDRDLGHDDDAQTIDWDTEVEPYDFGEAPKGQIVFGLVPTKFVTRAQWGARPPKSVSHSITPGSGGVAFHYEGPHMGTWTHDKCAGKVRQIQAFHMDGRGWADIAYSALVCPHGYTYAGRGPKVRTAANGTNDGNDRYYAVCGILGVDDVLTEPMKQAYRDARVWLRTEGGAGTDVKGHRQLKATSCPGDAVQAWVNAKGYEAPVAPKPPAPKPVVNPKPSAVSRRVQHAVTLPVDGFWRKPTDTGLNVVRAAIHGSFPQGVKIAQARVGAQPDGNWGPASRAALKSTISELQVAFGVANDGVWGTATENAYRRARAANYLG